MKYKLATNSMPNACHTPGVSYPRAGVQVIMCTCIYISVHAFGLYTHSILSNIYLCQCCDSHITNGGVMQTQ